MAKSDSVRAKMSKMYEDCEHLSTWSDWLLFGATIISVLLACINWQEISPNWYFALCLVNIVLIVGQFGCSTVADIFLYHSAERYRLQAAFDNGFGTARLEKSIEGYFANDEFLPGIDKYLAGTFESCYYSRAIAKKTSRCLWIKNIFFLILFGVIAYSGLPANGLLSLFQIFLTSTFLLLLIRHWRFVKEVDAAYEEFKRAYDDSKRPQYAALHAVLTYERVLAFYSKKLSSKVYNKYAKEIGDEWAGMKARYLPAQAPTPEAAPEA